MNKFCAKIAFIALLFPAMALGQDDRFYCSGTEPFWNAVLDHDKFTFKHSDKETAHFNVVNPLPFGNQSLDKMRLYVTKEVGTNKNAAFIIQKQECSDGMSDHKYDYQTFIIYDTYAFFGCCMNK